MKWVKWACLTIELTELGELQLLLDKGLTSRSGSKGGVSWGLDRKGVDGGDLDGGRYSRLGGDESHGEEVKAVWREMMEKSVVWREDKKRKKRKKEKNVGCETQVLYILQWTERGARVKRYMRNCGC